MIIERSIALIFFVRAPTKGESISRFINSGISLALMLPEISILLVYLLILPLGKFHQLKSYQLVNNITPASRTWRNW